ncbi:hypothetical protein MPTK1_6g15270 [Marchantia polymorpha subsp. ruderalis]|uniref:YDG domain-containing protein n=2 Tax=Marchantia polymorpha TaxID=3197 RepID=A0AAF6BS96_MARPO|nr:hypothetical protein MARPO_0056s0037 [Marchantia polymorpha]BBN14880.1 hypothetical protein Mp_6g15270 [Marchantia polymorpha subsp. ruderalis]|eukprot:PTQ37562.1 hypothetical protein MARPO_0056s0037 [Marchantia polymorpha]
MGLHPVEWRGPKLEGLTLDLGDLTPLPTDLAINNAFYSSVQEQGGTHSRLDLLPVTDGIVYHLQGHLGRNFHPHLPSSAGFQNHHHVQGESRVDMRIRRDAPQSPLQGQSARSENCHVLGGDHMPLRHILPVHPIAGGSGRKHARVQSSGDRWMPGNHILLPLLPGIAGPMRGRGDLAQLKHVNVKIEKVEPEVSTPLILPRRTVSLPTDLTPFEEFEDVKSPPKPLAMPVTIDLSDTESDGSVICWKGDGIGEQVVSKDIGVQSSTTPYVTGESLPDRENSNHPSCHLKAKKGGVGKYPACPVNPLKRKCSVIDLDSIIDLEARQVDFREAADLSGSEESTITRGFSANGSLVKQPECAELPMRKSSSQVDGNSDSPSQQLGTVTDLRELSDLHIEDLAKESDQQYVFDFAHDTDGEALEELMFDDDEELEPEFLLGDNGDIDQEFVLSSFDTRCDGLIPNPKDYQDEVPSWYISQSEGSEELNRRSAPVNTEQETYLGAVHSKVIEQGRGNAMQMSQATIPFRDTNHQLVPLSDRWGQATSEVAAQNPQQEPSQPARTDLNLSIYCETLPNDTADAVQALCKFVQASNDRGVFQPPPTSIGMTAQVASQDAATWTPNSVVDSVSVAPSVAERDVVAENGAVTVRSNAKNDVLVPKPEPVEFDKHGVTNITPAEPLKREWPENNAVGPVVDSRDTVINALKMFEQGRVQMLQEQVNADPNGKRVRADLKVACSMRKAGFWQNESRPIGECPGVKVGDCFTYRIEMAIIGLHRAVQAGIAVVSADYCRYRKPVAGSVVIGVNDTYKDDKDMGETVVYSGQGGLCADKSGTYQDQKLVRGNLALSNSYELGLPVRLIRGHKIQGTSTGILYSYDGLYKVIHMNYDVGVHKNMVYTFHLQRIPGQPPIHPPNVASLLYPANVVAYPMPLNSHASLPSSSQVPQSGGQDWIGEAMRSQGVSFQPSTSQTPNFGVGSWTGHSPSSQPPQSQNVEWTRSQPPQSQNVEWTSSQPPQSQNVEWTSSQPPQSQNVEWTDEYEEKPTLYLLPRSNQP